MKIKKLLSNSKVLISIFFILMITIGTVYGVIYHTVIAKKSSEPEPISNVNLRLPIQKDTSYDTFVQKYNSFAAKISDELLMTNKVVSPISIFSNLAILNYISNNDTRAQITKALNMSVDELNKNYPYFSNHHCIACMVSSYKTDNTCSTTKVAEERMDNSLWIQEGLYVNTRTTQNLVNNYLCVSYYVDFNNPKTNETIKKHIKDRTNDLIDLSYDIPKETLLSSISTNYLEDIWGDTKLEKVDLNNFKANGTEVLTSYYASNYISGKLVREPFSDFFYAKTKNNYKITFILPKPNPHGFDIYMNMSYDRIEYINNYEYQSVVDNKQYFTRCIFPAFKLESDLIDIKDALINRFNIKDLFDSSKCDLSNLLNQNACLSELKHKAKLEVNENGIKGASVTLGMVATSPAPIYERVYEELRLDETFGIIVSNDNNEIIFTGIVDKVLQ